MSARKRKAELPEAVRAGYRSLPGAPAFNAAYEESALVPIPELRRWHPKVRRWCERCLVAILEERWAEHQREVHPDYQMGTK